MSSVDNNSYRSRMMHGEAILNSVNQAEVKHCWVCFANEEDDLSAQWVSPCKCRGTAKWVHKHCLQRWIDEKQKGKEVEVACPQCNNPYIIVYPKCGYFVHILDFIDKIICKVCPFLAGGVLVGSVYWTAVTYGAVTIMQILGHKEGLNVMEKADPLIMLIGLPAIPMMLMLGRCIRWEDAVLKFWRKHSKKFPLLNLIFLNVDSHHLPRTPADTYSSSSDAISFTRIVCGGLILPTIATIFGKLLFQRVNSNFQRSIIGGFTFVGLKGIFKIYYKQQQFIRQAYRQIKNLEPTPTCNQSRAGSSAAPQVPLGGSNLPRPRGMAATSRNASTSTNSTNANGNEEHVATQQQQQLHSNINQSTNSNDHEELASSESIINRSREGSVRRSSESSSISTVSSNENLSLVTNQ